MIRQPNAGAEGPFEERSSRILEVAIAVGAIIAAVILTFAR